MDLADMLRPRSAHIPFSRMADKLPLPGIRSRIDDNGSEPGAGNLAEEYQQDGSQLPASKTPIHLLHNVQFWGGLPRIATRRLRFRHIQSETYTLAYVRVLTLLISYRSHGLGLTGAKTMFALPFSCSLKLVQISRRFSDSSGWCLIIRFVFCAFITSMTYGVLEYEEDLFSTQ